MACGLGLALGLTVPRGVNADEVPDYVIECEGKKEGSACAPRYGGEKNGVCATDTCKRYRPKGEPDEYECFRCVEAPKGKNAKKANPDPAAASSASPPATDGGCAISRDRERTPAGSLGALGLALLLVRAGRRKPWGS